MEMKKFTAQQLWKNTKMFVWAKLMVRLIAILMGAIFLSILIGLSLWQPDMAGIFLSIGIVVGSTITGGLVRILEYAIRVGHLAALAEIYKTGKVPKDPLRFGTERVKSRFARAAVFFALDRLVLRAVTQLQRLVGNVLGLLGNLPGLGKLTKIAQKIVGKSLKYVDECCLAWSFYNDDQSATKSALDGVVIYAQNWKPILGNAVKTTFLMMVVTWIIAIALIIVFAHVALFLGGGSWTVWGFLAFFFGIMIAFSIKRAFIDSWVMIRMLTTYFEYAPQTEIKFDIYSKLSGMSSSFKKLTEQVQDEVNTMSKETAQQPVHKFDPMTGQPLQ